MKVPAVVDAERRRVDVVVVVVTHNSETVLDGLIESLPRALEGCSWRSVIADNDSRDGTTDLARALAPNGLLVAMGWNAGYAAGINAGLTAAGPASAALVLNPDIRLGTGSVAVMIECMRRNGAGIVVPRMVDGEGALVHTLRREPNIRRSLGDAILGSRRAGQFRCWGEAVTRDNRYLHETRGDWATGAAMLISHECLDACGQWDESFFLYSEETDFCLRARDHGFKLVLAPQARARHLGGESKVSPRLRALLVVNRVRLYRRRHSLLTTAAFWLVAVAREASRIPLGRPVSRMALTTLLSPRRMRLAQSRARYPAGPPGIRTSHER